MSTRDRLTIAAAVAVALASAALQPVYDDLGWVVRVVGGVAAVAVTAWLARLVGVPRLLQPLLALAGLGLYAALAFAAGTLAYGLVPTGETVRALGDLVTAGLLDVEQLAPPVPTTPGLVLLAVLGVGAIAVAVDAVAVVLRRVAAAGLPLLLLFAVPSAVLPGGLGWLPFVLGAAGWLGLLLADSSDRVSRWGTPLRSARVTETDPSLGRVGRRIGAAALGVAVVVPALVPGLDGRLLGGGGEGGGFGGSRSTTTYNPFLSLAGQLRQPDPQALFTYTSDGGSDYTRLTTLDVFDPDSGWSSSELSGDIDDDRVQDGIPRPLGRNAATEPVRVEVDLTRQLAGPWLPVPMVPDEVEIDGPWLWDAEAETVFSTRTSVRDVRDPYVVKTARLVPDVALLREPQDPPTAITQVYGERPELSPEAQRFLDETIAGEATAYDRVAALQARFTSGEFEYSEATSVPPTNAPDALTAFLQTKEGFCEQYAAAMAALVRALGLPARVAVGFTGGTRVDDDSWLVTTDEAHAWPEVWFSGAGWVRFEPTPRSGEVSVPDYTLAPSADDPSAAPSAAPSVAPAVPQTGSSAGPTSADRADDGGLGAAGTGAGDDGGPSRLLLLVPAVLALLAVPALLAAVRRRRRWRSPGALVAWAAVHDDAVDVGHRWRSADSPRAAAAHLVAARSLPAPAAEALGRVATAAERSRYAREAGAVDAAALREDTAAVRAALLATAEPRDRWRARLAPPSTLDWASHRIGSAVADVLDRFDALLTAVGSRVRHPRGAARGA